MPAFPPPSPADDARALAAVRDAALPLRGGDADYDDLLDLAADATIVLLGEASHGTHEFYSRRAAITRRLVEEHGFTAVAVEADWPDAKRVDDWVRGASANADEDAADALSGFERFPQWMWRNADVLQFVTWLRARNAGCEDECTRTGFFGIDLYSLYTSIEAVLRYLDETDPEAARRARYRYACFEHFGEEPQAYGYTASFDISRSCEDEAVRQLIDLRRRASTAPPQRDELAADALFSAEQNARLVRNAEEYYRSMFRGRISSWNLRDRHMTETLQQLAAHLERQGRAPKIVVWAHNSHLGDARATEMGARGELNVGQLVREHWRERAVLVGFTTYTGTVTAADDWDAPARRKVVNRGMPGSYEALFHDVGLPDFYLRLRDGGAAADALRAPRLERAIGVIYRPDTERVSHYFRARLADQFDAVIHVDDTSAVQPLERVGVASSTEPPETFPSGI